MGFVEKIKSSVEIWKIEKYTKRRPAPTSEFEQKGVYLIINIQKPYSLIRIPIF